jgi:hypothetical protein
MNRAIASIVLVSAVAGTAATAHADIMEWYWAVEVNGRAVDASRPVVVQTGDNVDIELWALFDPYGAGFAGSLFAIATDEELHVSGRVNIDEDAGYGRNPLLAELTNGPGTMFDADGDDVPDLIDAIEVFQMPMYWEDNGDWSDPISVYSMGWTVTSELDDPISLLRAATADGTLISTIYTDVYGSTSDCEDRNATLTFIPAPATAVVCATGLLFCSRRRRIRAQ